MKVSRRKGLVKITVDDWSSTVVLTNIKTKDLIAKETFSDHVQAVLAAKAL